MFELNSTSPRASLIRLPISSVIDMRELVGLVHA